MSRAIWKKWNLQPLLMGSFNKETFKEKLLETQWIVSYSTNPRGITTSYVSEVKSIVTAIKSHFWSLTVDVARWSCGAREHLLGGAPSRLTPEKDQGEIRGKTPHTAYSSWKRSAVTLCLISLNKMCRSISLLSHQLPVFIMCLLSQKDTRKLSFYPLTVL